MASNINDKSDYMSFRALLSTSIIPIVSIIILSCLIYGQTYSFDYVLDDKLVITDNAFVKKGIFGWSDILLTESFEGYFGEQKNLVQGARYRPLSIMSFALEYQFFKLNPLIGHLVNLGLYIILCVFIYRFLRLIFRKDNSRTWYRQISFWATLLFCVHPIHTEVVANIKGRDEILVLIFMILALIQGIKYFEIKNIKNLGLTIILIFVALLSKENAIALPVLIPMTLYTFKQTSIKDMVKLGSILLLPIIAYLFLRYQVVGFLLSDQVITDIMNNPFYDMSFGDKYATIFYTLGLYLKLLVLPYPLTHDYYAYHIPIMSWSSAWVWIAFITHIALLLYAVRFIFNKNINAYFILFYLGTLFIVSNVFISVGTFMNERFLFVPSVAFCSWIVWKASALSNRPKLLSLKRVLPFAFGAIVLIFTILSFIRVPAWKNTLALNQSGVSVSQNSARANLFMGTAIFNQYKEETNSKIKNDLLEKSAEYIYKSTTILPSYGSAQKMKAGIIAERYKVDRNLDSLFDGFAEVITHNPGNSYVHEYLDYLTNQERHSTDLQKFYLNVGYNILFVNKINTKWAQHFLYKGLKINNNNPMLNYAYGLTLNSQGRQEAGSYLAKARELDNSVDQKFGK